MGTRGLTCVVEGGEFRVAQYGQWDHYPEAQGVTVFEFCRERLSTEDERQAFRERVRRLRDLTSEERAAISELPAWTKSHPHLSRDMGGEILAHIAEYQDIEGLVYQTSFAADSLFCEWAYVVDLDAGVLEVYNGFQSAPHDLGRFAKMQPEEASGKGRKYWPVALLTKFHLDDLPADGAAFVASIKSALPEGTDGE